MTRQWTRALVSVLAIAMAAACNRKPAEEPYVPGLGEIMTLQQMRHMKLWFAGQNDNWPLADYELDELNEGFEDAAKYHAMHKEVSLPIPGLIEKIMTEPLKQLRAAVDAKDRARFDPAFDAVTDGCNACHRAANFGFNVVTRPTINPYSNQVFEKPKT